MMTFGSLFAGIGGMDLGLERAGMRCLWQVEINAKRRQLLALRWPDAQQWDDVKTWPQPHSKRVDLICGGFPCQDISLDGKRAGIDGERSGLWSEYARIVRHFRPRFVLVENVAALLIPTERGSPAPISRVLSDLAACGYDAEWDCLPASAFGAYHERDRVFILAHAAGIDGRSHDFLEAGREWGASLQSRRLSGMALATDGKRQNSRLGCEPRLDRLVRRIPGAVDRLEGVGNSVFPAVAEWIGRRIVEHLVSRGNSDCSICQRRLMR